MLPCIDRNISGGPRWDIDDYAKMVWILEIQWISHKQATVPWNNSHGDQMRLLGEDEKVLSTVNASEQQMLFESSKFLKPLSDENTYMFFCQKRQMFTTDLWPSGRTSHDTAEKAALNGSIRGLTRRPRQRLLGFSLHPVLVSTCICNSITPIQSQAGFTCRHHWHACLLLVEKRRSPVALE